MAQVPRAPPAASPVNALGCLAPHRARRGSPAGAYIPLWSGQQSQRETQPGRMPRFSRPSSSPRPPVPRNGLRTTRPRTVHASYNPDSKRHATGWLLVMLLSNRHLDGHRPSKASYRSAPDACHSRSRRCMHETGKHTEAGGQTAADTAHTQAPRLFSCKIYPHLMRSARRDDLHSTSRQVAVGSCSRTPVD